MADSVLRQTRAGNAVDLLHSVGDTLALGGLLAGAHTAETRRQPEVDTAGMGRVQRVRALGVEHNDAGGERRVYAVGADVADAGRRSHSLHTTQPDQQLAE